MPKASCSLIELPNLELKVIKNNLLQTPKELDSSLVVFKFFDKFTREDFDVFLIVLHLFLNEKKSDGLIYFNTDDVLAIKGVKKIKQLSSNPSGYKKEVRERIAKSINNLEKIGIFTKIEYKNYNFAGYFDELITNDIRKVKVPIKLIQYNHYKKPWHKDIGYFLVFGKFKKTEKSFIQIKKLIKFIRKDYSFLAPNEVRARLEEVLDELSQDNIIGNWQYKQIDEEFLNCKNWLYYWKLLSVKVDFQNLARPPCFLNF